MRSLILSLIAIFLILSFHESANGQEASKMRSWNPRQNNIKETSLKEKRPPNVDLVITPVNSPNQLPINGTSVNYSYKITNQGLDSTNVLNTDPFINTAKSNGILAALQSVAELGPQESAEFDFSLNMCGCNRILNLDVMTDASSVKPEIDETNNLHHKKVWGEYTQTCPVQILTANTFDELHPDASDAAIVYENHAEPGSNIFAYNLSTQQHLQLSSNAPDAQTNETFPAVSGNNIAWIEFDISWEAEIIFLYNIATNQKTPIALAPLYSEKSSLRLDGDWIVVASNLGGSAPQINAYNVVSGEVQTINANPSSFNEEFLSISGNLLAWSNFGDNDLDVVAYRLDTGALENINTYPGEWALMPTAFDQQYAAFTSWDENNPSSSQKIIVYDTLNHQVLADWPVADVELLRADSGHVFWLDHANKIHAYNLSDNSQKVIYQSSADIGWFNVSDGRIVWDQNNYGDWDIHIGDLNLMLNDQPAPEPACVQTAF